MKTKLISIIRRNFCVFAIIACIIPVHAQTIDLNIDDNTYLIVSENTYVKVEGDVNLGGGSSGTAEMNGTLFDVDGDFNFNENSEFKLIQGTFNYGELVLDINSTVSYEGNAQTVKNWDYGILKFNGTGNMQIDGDFLNPTTCKSLIINSTGNALVIPEGKALTVENTVTNNAGSEGLHVKSSDLGDGSLISYTSDCDAKVERYIKGNRWHYISPSVSSASIDLFNTNNFIWWDASMQWDGLGDYAPWKTYSEDYLNIAQGYAYYYYEDVIEYQGYLNVSDYNITLYKSATGTPDYQGWNLVGNPYSSVLDWDLAVADGAVPAGTEKAIYFFDDETGDGAQSNYRYYVPPAYTGGYGVGTADANGLIPMGQAFFIKTNSDNVTLSLKKDYRVHNSQDIYKSDDSQILRLHLDNYKTKDETILRVVKESSEAFDAQYDARKLFVNDETMPQFYFIDINNTNTAISSVPKIEGESVFKLGFSSKEGQCKIIAESLELYEEHVYLVDKYADIFHDLIKEESYEFFHNGGNCDDRFYITFNMQTTHIEDRIAASISMYPNPASEIVYIENKSGLNIESLRMYTADGRTCKLFTGPIKKINVSDFQNGVYFISIQLENSMTYYDKIIVKK